MTQSPEVLRTSRATGTVETKSWSEQPYDEADGLPKIMRGSMIEAFHGGIIGDAAVECLLVYRDDGAISFAGMERVIGRIESRSGSFVLQVTGSFVQGMGEAVWSVVPGSGTGDLRGLRGEGGYHWDGQSVAYDLRYDFEQPGA